MSAILRAYGTDFDVDTFLDGCQLAVCAVKHRGEPVFPASQPKGRHHERSGVHVCVSDADFNEFSRQIEESVEFLGSKYEQVRRLCEWPGIEDTTLDFGIEQRDVPLYCVYLPPELIRLAGSLGIGIELSHYSAIEAGSGE